VTLDASYAFCERIARTHYENFPVASRLLPSRMRPHVAAIYAFARIADDIADEGNAVVAVRNARLDEWIARLHGATSSASALSGPSTLTPEMAAQAPPIFEALANTVRVCELPTSLLEDLVSAFRQDVTVTRYTSWEALFDYCRRSANPVGRLVLRIGGWRDSELDAASDAVCTALQLTNFWQDLAIDWGRGRLYVPAETHETTRAELAALDRGEWTVEWQQALASCAERTRALFDRGRAVCDGVTGRLRFELRATWLGGVRVLDRLEASRFDVFRARPSLGAGDLPSIAWDALWWSPR
jgi:hydroxysqualene synthase